MTFLGCFGACVVEFFWCLRSWVVLVLALLGCFGACVAEFEVLFCFGSLCVTEVMGKEVLAKLRGTHKVYLRHTENSSKEVNDILEHFYLIVVISIQLFV